MILNFLLVSGITGNVIQKSVQVLKNMGTIFPLKREKSNGKIENCLFLTIMLSAWWVAPSICLIQRL